MPYMVFQHYAAYTCLLLLLAVWALGCHGPGGLAKRARRPKVFGLSVHSLRLLHLLYVCCTDAWDDYGNMMTLQ